MTNAQTITLGLQMSSREDIQKTAREFMTDNGFKWNTQGRLAGSNAVEQWQEDTDAPLELMYALQTAILTMPTT